MALMLWRLQDPSRIGSSSDSPSALASSLFLLNLYERINGTQGRKHQAAPEDSHPHSMLGSGSAWVPKMYFETGGAVLLMSILATIFCAAAG